MQISDTSRSWLVRIAVAGALLLVPQGARASEQFPTAIQEAAQMPCTPSCTLCHGVDPGTASTYMNKKLGKTLFFYNNKVVAPGDSAALKANYEAYKASTDGAAVDADLKLGIDPETKVDLCSSANNVTYGCGAHVATKAPPSDASALFWIAGAMVIGALVRRTRGRQ
jgi:hypothetical protein